MVVPAVLVVRITVQKRNGWNVLDLSCANNEMRKSDRIK